MHTYCRLKDGRIMVLYSDNVEQKTVHLYDIEQLEDFNVEALTTEEFAYSEVDEMDVKDRKGF